MNQRKIKALELKTSSRIRRDGEFWKVPSQSTSGTFHRVQVFKNYFSCTCLDYELSSQKCKHVLAVESILKEESGLQDGPVPKVPRPTYRQNWPAYNTAQSREKEKVTELLQALCDGIPEPPRGIGRPSIPIRDAVFCTVFKVYSTVSGRRASTDIGDCAREGAISFNPHYNTVFKSFKDERLTPLLKSLVVQSARPLAVIETEFAADSTGFSTAQKQRWYDAKYGRVRVERQWVKLHAMCGVITNVITAAEVTDETKADAVCLEPLLKTTDEYFNMHRVSADKGYTGAPYLEMIVRRGAEPLIPFRKNTLGTTGTDLWKKLWHYYQFNREEFLAKYHKRSNIESTFSAVKRKFGDHLRSKTEVARHNELYCKIICHNLSMLVHSMYELNIVPEFWKAAA